MKSIITVAVLMALLASQSTSAEHGRAAEVPEVMLPEFSAERVEKGKKNVQAIVPALPWPRNERW